MGYRRSEEIAIADWIVTALGSLTLVNPFLDSYYNLTVAIWNSVVIGGVVFLLAAYKDVRIAMQHRSNKVTIGPTLDPGEMHVFHISRPRGVPRFTRIGNAHSLAPRTSP
jgi:hypothetical protein